MAKCKVDTDKAPRAKAKRKASWGLSAAALNQLTLSGCVFNQGKVGGWTCLTNKIWGDDGDVTMLNWHTWWPNEKGVIRLNRENWRLLVIKHSQVYYVNNNGRFPFWKRSRFMVGDWMAMENRHKRMCSPINVGLTKTFCKTCKWSTCGEQKITAFNCLLKLMQWLLLRTSQLRQCVRSSLHAWKRHLFFGGNRNWQRLLLINSS
jgi:hypothetical protein